MTNTVPGKKPIPRMRFSTTEDFLSRFLKDPHPVIFSNVVEKWPASAKWDFEWFSSEHGELNVPIEYGKITDTEHFRWEINSLKDYISSLTGLTHLN